MQDMNKGIKQGFIKLLNKADTMGTGEIAGIVLVGLVLCPVLTPFVVTYICLKIHKNKGY